MTIIYVHGALASKRSWDYVHKKVRTLVRRVPTEIFFEYDLKIVQSEEIVDALVKVINSTPDDVTLVGHSYGGVLGVAAARKVTEKSIKLITLAAPFAGIKLTLPIFNVESTFFKNISSKNEFMKNVKSNGLACRTISFITNKSSSEWLLGENDGVITRRSQCFFQNDPMSELINIEANHFEILTSDQVVNKLIEVM